MAMSLDDVLFGLIIAGIGLCAAYIGAEYIGWRDHIAAEMRKQASIRELYKRESSRQVTDLDLRNTGDAADEWRVLVKLNSESPARRRNGETVSNFVVRREERQGIDGESTLR